MCCNTQKIEKTLVTPLPSSHKNHHLVGPFDFFLPFGHFLITNFGLKTKKLAILLFKASAISLATFLLLIIFLTLIGHDLAKCPANAAESLADLSAIDPSATDLGALLNITDKKSNQTTDQQASNNDFNIQEPIEDLITTTSDQPNVDISEDKSEKSEKIQPPPIATFEEWTKEKLMHKEKKPMVKDPQQNGNGQAVNDQKVIQNSNTAGNLNPGTVKENSAQPPSTKPKIQEAPLLTDSINNPIPIPTAQITKRNYASKECGAKVLLANDEAEHRNAVLNDKERDEYMRNPCEKAHNKFLIIELCETIQPNFLELANFELFSSGPREIRLSVSERYPTLEWTPVGQFVAADSREMQSFDFTSTGIYAKFIKLELLSHYGKEHYCTLTTIRVSGISMVDEYEAEAQGNSIENVAIVNKPVENSEPTGTTIQQPVEKIETTIQKPTENEQDPSNESDKEKKPFVLNKVVDLVGNLGHIKDAIGKTFLGNRQRGGEKIWPNSCTHFTPLHFDPKQQSSLRCHLFNLIDIPKSTTKFVLSSKSFLMPNRTNGQKQFLHYILKLAQCPTVIVEPKKVDTHEVEEQKEKVERIQEIPPQNTAQNQIPKGKTNQSSQNFIILAPPSSNSLPGIVSTHKESIFMKLNKRLSALELNMSLSSEYLSELSRRYVAQQDDYTKKHDRDLKTLEEMVSRLGENLKTTWSAEINRIRSDIEDLAMEMRRIKQSSRHIPPPFDSTSSLTLMDHSNRAFEQNCYNMLPPAQEDNDSNQEPVSFTNEQIVAIITISNLIGFTLFACVYLLYKIFSRRSRIQKQDLSSDEIRLLVQRELDQLRRATPRFEGAGSVNDIQLKLGELNEQFNSVEKFTPNKRPKHRTRPQQKTFQNGIQSVNSSTLSIPSTITTSSALSTMSSSPSLSDNDQQESMRDAPLIMNLIGSLEKERPASANDRPQLSPLKLGPCPQKEPLSPVWQTVQNKRKLSDKTLKVQSRKQSCGKIKVN